MRTARKLMAAAGVLLLPAFVEGAGLQFSSAWAATPAKVDGTADTWSPFLKPLDDIPMVIGVQNDADFLYLCFKTSNPNLKRQLRSTGLTVWANGKGKANTNRGFGVRYPLVKGKGDKQHEGGPPTPTPAEGSVPAFVEPPPKFEFIGPNFDNRRIMEFDDDQPVVAALGDDSGVMVLELRIPLKASDALPLAIGVTPGTPIGLMLATMPPPKPPGKVWAENVGGHPTSARQDEDAPEMPSPISLWVLVRLATPPVPPAAK